MTLKTALTTFCDPVAIATRLGKGEVHADTFKYDTTPVLGALASTAHAVEMAVLIPLSLLFALGKAIKQLSKGNREAAKESGKNIVLLPVIFLALSVLFAVNAVSLGLVGYTAKRLIPALQHA